MNMRRFIPLIILLTILLSGCKKNEFLVEFKLPATVSDSYTMVYYASDPVKGFMIDQVAVITAGKGTVKCITRYPTLIYVFKGGNEPSLVIYAERGDKILVEGDNPSPQTWKVSGNLINEELTEWRMKNRQVLSERNPVKVNEAVKDFVKVHTDDPVSMLLLQIYYDRGRNPKEFDSLYKSLKGDAVDPEWSDLVSRNDMVGGYSPMSFKTGPLIFRTAGNGCDTLRFDSVPALLFFANNNYGSRAADVTRIKELLKERRDSGKPQIVDVNMEPDSSAWRYQARRDSLKGAVRSWLPLSFSDTVAKSLGVKTLPTFVVIGKGGAILYRGTSATEAMSELRRVAKKK